MREFNISILGEQWEVRIRKEEEEERLKDCDGFTDWTARVIVIGDRREGATLRFPVEYMKKVLRHEIVHAVFRESGLGESMYWGIQNEEMLVDWIAIQLPKIAETCEAAERKMKVILDDGD